MRIPGFAMRRSFEKALLFTVAMATASGCGGASPGAEQPQGQAQAAQVGAGAQPSPPPTPKSVTKANPGGDAADPEKAALERLLNEPWGFRKDRWNTLRVPLVDWQNWRRVRIWGHPTRATYRYGDDHRAIDTTLYTTIEGSNDPAACLAKFNAYVITTANAYGVRMSEPQLIKMNQQVDDETRPMLVEMREGTIDSILANDDYVGALAVYQSWPGTCLVRGFAVVSTNHRDLAVKVRDRWIREGAPGIRWEKRVKETPPTEAR